MARIALDAMGGDFAPHATVAGALLALAELDAAHSIQLIGRAQTIEAELHTLTHGNLAHLAGQLARIEVVDAPEVIEMTDKPAAAIRAKPHSSMVVGIRRHAQGLADAFVSAGNTGAQMAASVVLLRLHPGLTRPCVATVLPTVRQPVILVDAGANVDCSSNELSQFARLGVVYAEDLLGRHNPAVGLLSIGEEPEKGNAVVKETHQLLLAAGLNFIGNVEGRDLPVGRCDRGAIDVVVCDGFVGNVVLKFYEGIGPALADTLRAAGVDEPRIAAALGHLDYSGTGGAPLLGVKGISIIAHGKSSPRAVMNAIKVGVRAVEAQMDDHIGRRLEQGSGAGT